MDVDDYDFPPDPVADKFDPGDDVLQNLSLRTLSDKPIAELPPTVVPDQQQQRPIRQLLQGGQQRRRRRRRQQERSPTRNSAPRAGEEDANPVPVAGQKRARFDWTEEELREFYTLLSQYGTDFNAIAVMYTGRSRVDVKRLYHRELRRRRDDVRAALAAHEAIDLGVFRARLKRREEERIGPARRLDHDEEEALRQIEAGLFSEHREDADAELTLDDVMLETNNMDEERRNEGGLSGASHAALPSPPANEYDYDDFKCEDGNVEDYDDGGGGGRGDNDDDRNNIPLAELSFLKDANEGTNKEPTDETLADDLVGLNDSLDDGSYCF